MRIAIVLLSLNVKVLSELHGMFTAWHLSQSVGQASQIFNDFLLAVSEANKYAYLVADRRFSSR